LNYTSEILEQLIRKVVSENREITLTKFKEEYSDSIKGTHSEKYTKSVEISFNKLIDFVNDIPIIKIDSRIIERFIIHKFNKSKYSAALYYRNLKAAFNKALLWGYIPSNPWLMVKFPKFQRPRPSFINEMQLNQIIDKVEPAHIKDIYIFAFYTGLRLSELLNLRWENVNLKESIIQIGDDDFITKSKKIRTIPLCLKAYEVLSNRVPKIIHQHKKNFVFTKSNSYPFTGDYLSKRFKKAVRAAGMDDKVHFHSLRHSFASNLIMKGVPIYHLKDLLGHSSIAVTEIYSHLSIDALKEAVNKFDMVAVS